MKERPILFSAPMVRALLAGTKTQTRRVVKPQPPALARHKTPMCSMEDLLKTCPYGLPGDRLWVREAWAPDAGDWGAFSRWNSGLALDRVGPAPQIHFRADGSDPHIEKWRPSIHMPRWASRIVLEVVTVRVERLLDISDDDAKAEGLSVPNCKMGWGVDGEILSGTPSGAYRVLWESINGHGSWDTNPWVWVVEFKRAPT